MLSFISPRPAPGGALLRLSGIAAVPDLDATLAESVVRLVGRLRDLRLRKSPSVAETVDWARTLIALGATELDEAVIRDNLGVLLKHQDDILRATKTLNL